MFNISDYFKKFAKIEGDSLLEKDIVLSVLHEVCGTGTVKCEIKKGVLYVTGSPMVKSLLFTKKARIIELLKEKLPRARVSDVR